MNIPQNPNGQAAMAGSQPVVIANNQSAVPVSATALPLPSGAATETTLGTRLSESDFDTKTGSLTETAPATDTASSGLNGRLQRIAQRLTSLITAIGSPLQAGGAVSVSNFPATQAVSAASLPLPTGAATETTLAAASAKLPATLGQKAMTASMAVVLASDQSNVPVNNTQINGVAILAGNGVTGTGSQRVTMASDNSAIASWGQGAVASAVPTGAQLTGARAATSNPTAATNGNMVGIMADKLGKVVSVPALRDMKATQKTTITSSVAETTIVTAGGAGVFNDIYRIVITNTSATACNVTIKDATAGTTRYIFAVPATSTVGFSGDAGSATVQAAANGNWTATCSASVASIEITVDYVKNI